MPTSWSSLYLSWSSGMTDYIARHIANYSRIQTCLDYLYALSGGGRSMLDVPLGLQEIFDREGLIGYGSYMPPEGTKTAPDYNLVIPIGAYWSGNTLLSKQTTTTIPLVAVPTDTYYLELDGAGNPSIKDTPSDTTIWQFEWNATSHQVTAVARYTGVAVLFDGDDYASCLHSSTLAQDFDSMGARFQAIEMWLDSFGNLPEDFSYYDFVWPNLTLNPGKYRNGIDVINITPGPSVELTANAWNYVEIDTVNEVIAVNQVGYTEDFIPLHRYHVTVGHTIDEFYDDRCWLTVGGGGGVGGHTQNTDIGTTSPNFKLLKSVTGAPSQDAQLQVERGTSSDVAIKWNETLDKWQYTEDGSIWKSFGELNVDLGAQEISKFVAIDDPPLVHEELSRGTSADYEEIDLSSLLAVDAPDGVAGVVLRIVYWDTEEPATISSYVRFRKAGIGESPLNAYTVFSPANMDWSRPQMMFLGASDDYKIEFFLNASGGDTSNLRVYLLGYFKTILGVGTQNVQFVSGGLEVPANDHMEFDLPNFVNRALVYYFKIEEVGGLVSGDFDVEIYSNDSYAEVGLEYKAVGMHSDEPYEDSLPWFHNDGDSTKELHIRIANKDLTQAATFDITIRCEMFA